jgi:hypothetical protein
MLPRARNAANRIYKAPKNIVTCITASRYASTYPSILVFLLPKPKTPTFPPGRPPLLPGGFCIMVSPSAIKAADDGAFVPIRHHVRTTLAAAITPHSQSKGRHGGISWQVIDVHDCLMTAGDVRTMDDQRPHAIGAHIAERHWIS